jgi:hypothetical protein
MANPLFGRQVSLAEDLLPLAEQPFVRSAWSDWSEPASVGWSEYFFIENASSGSTLGGSGSASARAELYRFHYGYWRVGSVALEPGDRFVASVELPKGLQVWDLQREAGQQAWKPEEGATQPAQLTLVPKELRVEADAWLMDVVPSAFTSSGGLGGTTQEVLAVIRGPDGQLSRRSPLLEKSTPVYQIIRGSALAGQVQVPSVPGQERRRDEREAGQFDRDLSGPGDSSSPTGHGGGAEDGGGGGGGGG